MPKDAAENMLAEVWGQRGFPVDPIWIARQFGVSVVTAALPDEVSGALIKDQGKDPVIVLSEKDSKNRMRFTTAHELGHYIQRQNQDYYEYIDLRSPVSSAGNDPDEVFANQFAANLLMPAAAVREQVRSGRPAFLIALHFGVSGDSMSFRLRNLGLTASA